MPDTAPARVVLVDGLPRSGCCNATITCQKDYTDTHVFEVTEADTDDNGVVIAARYSFVETYDGIDGFNWQVTCSHCRQPIDDEHTEFDEG